MKRYLLPILTHIFVGIVGYLLAHEAARHTYAQGVLLGIDLADYVRAQQSLGRVVTAGEIQTLIDVRFNNR